MSRGFPVHPGVRPACPDCGGQGYRVVRRGEHAAGELCACITGCPHCHGSGFVAVPGGRGRARCGCFRAEHRLRRLDETSLPGVHAASTRTTFQFTKSRNLREPFMAVNRWLSAYRPGEDNRGLVLHGPVGTGKTHLLCAMVRELVLDYGVTARFVEFSHLLTDLKYSFDRKEGTADLLEPLVEVDVLAIDEIGKGRNTEWEGTVLDELVSRRYNAGRTILGTTNYAPHKTGAAAPNLADAPATQPGLWDRVGDRVFSRLSQMCDFIPVEGEDWRRSAAATRPR